MFLEEAVQLVLVGEIPDQAAVPAGQTLLVQSRAARSRQRQKPQGVWPKDGGIPAPAFDQSPGHHTVAITLRAAIHGHELRIKA